ncbi:hypothetical protein Q765_09010 [Flavobacterium rivuli WB 3.3-2 = DSM 21788]|uniref:DUF4861 domain-containing protein n=1 Tax=Flavobacterium rivuli WB 3.3-2 = DSM 21788 TaxID=1121895 RepID=A0A0A2M2A2_9FLAO|nr:DUF4861 family protein [Flavobacterium rivuli]KGO86757.1 hypothetical protein Q765_09010 [Flavobacterium rivuli WB 3.3-2 = DSM 21788]
MRYIKTPALLTALMFTSFAGLQVMAQESLTVTIKNNLGIDRNEVVTINSKDITGFLKGKNEKDIRVKNNTTGKMEPLQWIDNDGDKNNDELLFMATVKPNSSAIYTLVSDASVPVPVSQITTFSRFVPERTDDYTWENDKVAFRTYGPDAQMRTEQHRENGTLSSGIDIWLKRTPLPIINKWYKGYLTDPMFYHSDRGEGYDPYHVGASRGTGGTGIWEKDSLLVSKNFVTYKTIAVGPLRTVFELSYAPFSPYQVKETKRISLDLGSNFSKFEVMHSSAKQVPNYATGITLHQNEGEAEVLTKEGVFAYHEKIDGTYLGEGIIMQPNIIEKAFVNKSKTKDQSNLIIVTKASPKLTYYAGFVWEKSGQGANKADWDALLKKQAQIIKSPLTVTVK